MIFRPFLFLLVLVFAFTASSPQHAPDPSYYVYVVSESADRISIIRFAKGIAAVEREFSTGSMPTDVDGPHGIAVSRDRRFYYVSLGHGRPYGSVWKYSTADDRVVGRVTLGRFPATIDLTRDGSFLYVVNFNLHGDMEASSVSVVTTDDMQEIARIPTCTMPHGSRLNHQGTRHYSACMMDDMLIEIDTSRLKVSRHFVLTAGSERGLDGGPPLHHQPGSRHQMHSATASAKASCSPTWAQPSNDGSLIYVACNNSDEIVEVSAADWKARRRIPARPGVYNLAITKDDRLVATNKRDQSVSVFDLKTGRELARIPTGRKVVHGVVVSPDDRYAFISVEGVGSEPGTVEIIDLESLRTVATVDVAPQAAGIEFYRLDLSQPKQESVVGGRWAVVDGQCRSQSVDYILSHILPARPPATGHRPPATQGVATNLRVRWSGRSKSVNYILSHILLRRPPATDHRPLRELKLISGRGGRTLLLWLAELNNPKSSVDIVEED